MPRAKRGWKLDAFKGRITVIRERPTTAGSSSALSRDATGFSWRDDPTTASTGTSTGTTQAVARLCASRRAPDFLVRMAHHPRRPGRVLAEAQDPREGLRPARASRSLRRSRRPGRGSPADLRQRHAVDTSYAEATFEEGESRGRYPCGAGTSGDPISREQHHAPRRLRPLRWWRQAHFDQRRTGSRGPPTIVGRRTPSALAYAA